MDKIHTGHAIRKWACMNTQREYSFLKTFQLVKVFIGYTIYSYLYLRTAIE